MSSSASRPATATSSGSASRDAPNPGGYQRLFLIAGHDPTLEPGSMVIAEVVGITDDELAEYAELQAHFGDLLRDGSVTVDVGGIRHVLGEDIDQDRAPS